MNEYLVKYKVATVAELVSPFEIEGYEFNSYSKDWWEGDAWTASKVVKARSAGEARLGFMKGLIPLIEKCSVISQCAFRITANSYYIYKLTNNEDKVIFIHFVKEVGHTGLHFDEEHISQLPKLSKIPNQQAFMYLTEASNATTFYTRLTMLLSAVEALAGETVKKKKIVTNHDAIKKIIGDEMHDKLYTYRTGLRHKLLHGNFGAHHLFEGLTDALYNKIMNYLRNTYDIQITEGVVHPPRNFYENYVYTRMFMKFKNTPLLELRELIEAVDERLNSRTKEDEIFIGYTGTPTDY